ncbi:hypothetical protein PGQ11_002968 [Apiospora arundinis]|uniref:Uncharacterized protein n=1 Tax=Apiospora arundinis TaxID=335852 RepID=A0ABR2J3T6_9PEZI
MADRCLPGSPDAFRRARIHHRGDWRHLEERKRFLATYTRWFDGTNYNPALQAPPLVIDDRTIEDREEKALALRKTLLKRFTDAEDLEDDPLEIPMVPRRVLPATPTSPEKN